MDEQLARMKAAVKRASRAQAAFEGLFQSWGGGGPHGIPGAKRLPADSPTFERASTLDHAAMEKCRNDSLTVRDVTIYADEMFKLAEDAAASLPEPEDGGE